MKYRKKPVVIEAIKWVPESEVIRQISVFMGGVHIDKDSRVLIDTLEGQMAANPGDWIIKGVKGEFYPCKPDIFEATYEPA